MGVDAASKLAQLVYFVQCDYSCPRCFAARSRSVGVDGRTRWHLSHCSPNDCRQHKLNFEH